VCDILAMGGARGVAEGGQLPPSLCLSLQLLIMDVYSYLKRKREGCFFLHSHDFFLGILGITRT